ncbi:histidinol-phosphatase [Gemmatimonadota bacterium]
MSLAVLLIASAGCTGSTPAGTWWKGNTHTHSLWSDGDAAPEEVAEWYRSHGYNFLVISDHNTLQEGERFRGDPPVRLRTHEELQDRFNNPGSFLLIEGEELTDSFDGHPVHMNVINPGRTIPAQGGNTLPETIGQNHDAARQALTQSGRPGFIHYNHPNFGWGLTWEHLAAIEGIGFFEVFNGHPSVRNYGDDDHPGTEEMWDLALSLRLMSGSPASGLLYGIATDDAHSFLQFGPAKANPGRAWVMVRAEELSERALIDAYLRGDFYGSTGVILADIETTANRMIIRIEAEEGIEYTTRFIGTGQDPDGTIKPGEVLYETTRNPASYRFSGDELYVRAKVISSKPHPNPYAAGDVECAWIQPVRPGG